MFKFKFKFESDVGVLIGDRSLTAEESEEAVRCFKDKHRAQMATMRDHYVHPPPRVNDGILVFDAAALTLPRLLYMYTTTS
jgi:hypothetical protein